MSKPSQKYIVTASGFSEHLSALNGVYQQNPAQLENETEPSHHHKKLCFKKSTSGEIEGCSESNIYYWDERDGPGFCGWWLAPQIASEQVWAYNPSKSEKPPVSGWRVPWLEQTPNEKVKILISPAPVTGTPATPAATAAAAATPPAATANSATTVQKRPATAGNDVSPSTKIPKIMDEKAQKYADSCDRQITNIESIKNKISSNNEEELLGENSTEQMKIEFTRNMQLLQSSLAETRKFVETHKNPALQNIRSRNEVQLAIQIFHKRMEQVAKILEEKEALHTKIQSERTTNLEKEMPEKCSSLLNEIESALEATKDESVVLTCELVEHSSPEDIMEVDENAGRHIKIGVEKILELKDYLNACQATSRTLLTGMKNTPSNLEEAQARLSKLEQLRKDTYQSVTTFERDLNAVKRQIEPHVTKAKIAIQKKKAEEERKKAQEEERRLKEASKIRSLRGLECGLYSEYLVKKLMNAKSSSATTSTSSITGTNVDSDGDEKMAQSSDSDDIVGDVTPSDVERYQGQLLGLFMLMNEDFKHKDTQHPSQKIVLESLKKNMDRIRQGLFKLQQKAKDVVTKTQTADDRFAVSLGNAVNAYLKETEKTSVDGYLEAAGLSLTDEGLKTASIKGDTEGKLGYDSCIKWLSEKVFLDDVEKCNQLKKFLPSVWRKAVSARKRINAASKAKEELKTLLNKSTTGTSGTATTTGTSGSTATDDDSIKAEFCKKILELEAESDDEAMSEKIGEPEFNLFISNNFFICTHRCMMTNSVDSVLNEKPDVKDIKQCLIKVQQEKDINTNTPATAVLQKLAEDRALTELLNMAKQKYGGNSTVAGENLKEEGTEAKGPIYVDTLESDDVVSVVEGPITISHKYTETSPAVEIVRLKVRRVKDQKEAWISLRTPTPPTGPGSTNPNTTVNDNVQRYTNQHEIRQETVLTDTYELKGFKVVRRIKKDELCLALGPPVYNSDAELLRVKVKAIVDGAEGFITVKGSHGTLFLQSLCVKDAKESKENQQKSGHSFIMMNYDEESKRYYIQQETGMRRKIFPRAVTVEKLEEEMRLMAEEVPKDLKEKLDYINKVKSEFCDMVQSLIDMGMKTDIGKMIELVNEAKKKDKEAAAAVVTKIAAQTQNKNSESVESENEVTGNATVDPNTMSDETGPAVTQTLQSAFADIKDQLKMDYNMEWLTSELMKCDIKIKELNNLHTEVRQICQALCDAKSAHDPTIMRLSEDAEKWLEYMRKENILVSTGYKAGPKISQEGPKLLVEPDSSTADSSGVTPVPRPDTDALSEDGLNKIWSGFSILRLRVREIIKEIDYNRDFQTALLRRKTSLRKEMEEKITSFNRIREQVDLNELGSKIMKDITEKTEELKRLEQAKKDLYTEINGTVSATGSKNTTTNNNSKSTTQQQPNSSSNRPNHTASRIAVLGLQFEEMVTMLEAKCGELSVWLSNNDPTRLINGNKERFILISMGEKQEQMKELQKPFQLLNRNYKLLQNTFKADRDFLSNELQGDILLRARTEIATYFRQHDPRSVFLEKLAPLNPENEKEKEKSGGKFSEEDYWVTCDIVSQFMEKALEPEPIPQAVITKIYCSLVGNDKRRMTLDEFCLLFAKMHYRVTKDCIMTDVFDIVEEEFNPIATLKPGDIIRLIGDVKKLNCYENCNIQRFEAETVPTAEITGKESTILESKAADGTPVNKTNPNQSSSSSSQSQVTSGWVTLVGSKSTPFLQLHTPGYRCVKQTVLTDIFSMKNFKPVVRLNVGDQLRAIGFPRREPQSGLLRVKAVTVGKKSGNECVGYVTVEGNQNSVYLETCDQLIFPEDTSNSGGAGSGSAKKDLTPR